MLPLQHTGRPSHYYVADAYTDPRAQKPRLVLQHGYSRLSAFFHQWVPYLARSYRILRADLRGLGSIGSYPAIPRNGRRLDRTNVIVEPYLDKVAVPIFRSRSLVPRRQLGIARHLPGSTTLRQCRRLQRESSPQHDGQHLVECVIGGN